MSRIRPSWDQYFMDIAKVVATRSPDDKTQVGCVVVDINNRIVSTGYNGTPPGFDDSFIDWFSKDKMPFILHAEMNSILYAKQELTDCILYCTLGPCLDCLKHIKQVGIRKVIYLEDCKMIIEAKNLAKCFNVELIKFVGVV